MSPGSNTLAVAGADAIAAGELFGCAVQQRALAATEMEASTTAILRRTTLAFKLIIETPFSFPLAALFEAARGPDCSENRRSLATTFVVEKASFVAIADVRAWPDGSSMVQHATVNLDDFYGNGDIRVKYNYLHDATNIMKHARLTRYELELMDVLWQLGEGTVQDVCDGLERPLAYTTVMTTLRLLHSKKKVLKRVKRGRAHVYQPIVSRDAVSRSVMSDLQGVLFREQLPSLMLGLMEDGSLTQADINSLKAAITKVERQEQ